MFYEYGYTKRIEWIDTAKGICILLVEHTTSLFFVT